MSGPVQSRRWLLVGFLPLVLLAVIVILAEAGAIPPRPQASATSFSPLGEPGVGGQVTALTFVPDLPEQFLAGGDLLGTARSDDGGESWLPGQGLTGWEISSFLALGGGRVWAGSMSGPVVSTDGGRSWESRRSGMPATRADAYTAPVQTFLLGARSASSLLAFGGTHRRWPSADTGAFGAVWSSDDSGETWAWIGTVNAGTPGEQRNVVDALRLRSHPDTLLVALDSSGVWRSDDEGVIWEKVQGGLPDGAAMSLTETDGAVLAAYESTADSGAGGVWRSEDGGSTWSESSSGLRKAPGESRDTASHYKVVRSAPSSPRTVYTADVGYAEPAVYRSDDSGRTWRRVLETGDVETAYASGATADVLAVDPTNPLRVLVGQSEYVLLTEDGGEQWRDVTSRSLGGDRFAGRGFSGLVATDIAASPDGSALALTGFDGGNLLVGSAEGGWRRPLRADAPYGGGRSVTWAGTRGDTLLVALGQNGTYDGLARSSDAGLTWTVPIRRGLPVTGVCDLAAVSGSDRVWASADGDLYMSVDAGANWRLEVSGGGLDLCSIAVTDDGQVFAGGAQATYVIRDGTAQSIGGPSEHARLEAATDGRVFAAAWRGPEQGVWVLDPAPGSAWRRILEGVPARGVAVAPWDPDLVAVVSDDPPFHDVNVAKGVHLSRDGGRTFELLADGLGVRRGAAIAFVASPDRHLVFGTNGGGFMSAKLD